MIFSKLNRSIGGKIAGTRNQPPVRQAASSSSNSSRFDPSALIRKLTPVTLPPGRLKLATRPSPDGVAAGHENNRNRGCRGFGCDCRSGAAKRGDHLDSVPHQIGRQGRQALVAKIREVIVDRHILVLDIAGFPQALQEGGFIGSLLSGAPALSNPTTGIACCCARATVGHATALPSPAMNSRRLIGHPSAESIAYRGRGSMSGLSPDPFLQRG
jgi:hypothetical protein